MTMSNLIHLKPNEPLTLTLLDPYADSCERYDAERQVGEYRTTDGKILALPRPAVIELNALDPQPGEEIGVCRYTGKQARIAVWLTAQSEKDRATEGLDPVDLVPALQASIEHVKNGKPASKPVTPIRRKPQKQDDQPRLFDRKGTGTDGPAPQLAPAAIQRTAPAVKGIPYQDILRHIVRTVKRVLEAEKLQLGDDPTQKIIVTLYIDAARRTGVAYDFTTEAGS